MNTRTILTLGASALLLGTAAVGIASASGRDAAADARAAAGSAAKATRALARHDGRQAIAAAEGAVTLAPRDANYRVLLGQSYLAAGRFVSARAAFGDAVALAPTNGKAALNLVLTQIATGDWASARRSLDEHGAAIAPADRGLALALAGDPAGAVQLLTQVARSPDTNPKVRQNLALSLALAGEWQASRTVAAVDVSPADLDARMEQWATFAHPHAAADQVATLLDVTPVEDAGQPLQLALAGEPSVALAAAASPVLPVAPSPTPPAARPTTVDAAVAAVEPQPGPRPGFVAANQVTFGPRAEVVQPLHAPAAPMLATRTLRPEGKPVKVALAAAPAAATPTAKGNWFVQLGAYGSAKGAQDAWRRAGRHLTTLAAGTPNAASFTAHKTTYYRLSVGGFARAQADALCRNFKAAGGDCFVRAGAGDQLAAWAKKPVQVAAR